MSCNFLVCIVDDSLAALLNMKKDDLILKYMDTKSLHPTLGFNILSPNKWHNFSFS